MSFQFLHVDSYGRSAGKSKAHSAAAVIDEAERKPEACPHVEHPAPPRLLYGDMPRVALARAEAWAATAKDTRGRKLRKDGCCLAAGVISFPAERIQHWHEFREATLDWLKEKYGPRLISAVEHTDEAHPHLHFYAVPLAGERFGAVQDGKQAIDDARAQGESRDKQQAAYREAMRALQDQFFSDVASRFGLARSGPRRRRLSRAGWRAEQKILELLACEDRNKEATAEELEELRREVRQLVENNSELRKDVLELGKENLGLKKELKEMKTYREFCERYELDPSKEYSKKEYGEYTDALLDLMPKTAQKSPVRVETEKSGGSLDALKKSAQKAKKQPSPASKKPRFSAGG